MVIVMIMLPNFGDDDNHNNNNKKNYNNKVILIVTLFQEGNTVYHMI